MLFKGLCAFVAGQSSQAFGQQTGTGVELFQALNSHYGTGDFSK